MSMVRLLTAVANKSSSDTSRRVRAARQRQAENGQYGGGRRPFGFGADGVTVIESEAAEIRTAAAAVLAEGDDAVSLKAIARDLRDRGVPTVTGAKWTAETLRDVLMKPRLAGLSIHRGTEIEITGDIKPQWMRDPILPVEQWRAVMARLTDPARTTGPGNAPRWLLSGIALCGVCADGTSVHVRGGRPQVPGYCCQKRSHLRRSAYAADAYVGMVLCARLAREDAADLLTPPGTRAPLCRRRLAVSPPWLVTRIPAGGQRREGHPCGTPTGMFQEYRSAQTCQSRSRPPESPRRRAHQGRR
jgi:hypothetical protein